MHMISNDLSTNLIKDILTESRIQYNTRSTVKVEKDANGNLKCTKNSNLSSHRLKLPPISLDCIRYLGPKIGS